MFDSEFFPTPNNLISDMIAPHYSELSGYKKINVLDPSAWSWVILDYVQKKWNRNIQLFAIEKNPDLQATIRGKKYKILDSDFLEYEKDTEFDYIFMNPPFSNWDEHLLKAWEIAENTSIVCILNAETIRNPFSKRRQHLAKIIEDNWGTVEYKNNAFSDADRKTDVEIAIVRLTKVTEKTKFSFEWMESETVSMNEEILNNEIATRNMIDSIIIDYKRSKDMFAEWMRLIQRSGQIASSISDNYNLKPFEIAGNNGTMNDRYTEFVGEMKYWIWNKIAKDLKIEQYMTTNLKSDFWSYMKEQGSLAITEENIRKFADMIFMNRGNIMENAIHEVFDEFTKYYKENREHVEWWKTNDKWKVNRKIILPHWVTHENWRSDSWYQINWWCRSKMDDIDKSLCYIDGKSIEKIVSIEKALETGFRMGEWKTESTFFDIRFYKKWTVHITFRDEKLWKEFNMRACEGKNWLPESEVDEWKKSKQQKSTWIIIV